MTLQYTTMIREHELIYRMMEEHDVTKAEMRRALAAQDELEDEYGKAIELLGMFDREGLEDAVDYEETEEQ